MKTARQIDFESVLIGMPLGAVIGVMASLVVVWWMYRKLRR
jgi:hypothetical protein